MKGNRRSAWWTSEVEDGHWVLIVSKAEIQLGFDPWGYPPGELKASIQALLPNPPSGITIAQLATELSILPEEPSRAFKKAIERNLRKLRDEGVVRSVRIDDDTLRLGYHLITGTKSNATAEKPIKHPAQRTILRLKPNGVKVQSLRPDLQKKVMALLPAFPAVCTAKQLAAYIETECRLNAGEAVKAVKGQLEDLHRMGLAHRVAAKNESEVGWCRNVP